MSDAIVREHVGEPAPGAAVHEPAEFARLVRDALAHLYDPVALQTHPLARCLSSVGEPARPATRAGEALRTRLLDVIAQLRPAAKTSELSGAAAAWRRHRLLELRYVEAQPPEQVQEQLGIEKSQYYREHARALEAVVSLLVQHWPAAARVEVAPARADGAGGPPCAAPTAPPGASLPADLTGIAGPTTMGSLPHQPTA